MSGKDPGEMGGRTGADGRRGYVEHEQAVSVAGARQARRVARREVQLHHVVGVAAQQRAAAQRGVGHRPARVKPVYVLVWIVWLL